MDESAARPRVALLFGGRSAEHAISCVTAASVLAAIDRNHYDVVPVGITPDGQWVLAVDDPARLQITDGRLPAVDPAGAEVVLTQSAAGASLRALSDPGAAAGLPAALGEVDVVFPLLHGPYGEDGTIQGMLELAAIPYVGSGVFASAACMDKHFMKILLAGQGLPVGPHTVVLPGSFDRDSAAVHESVASLGYPVFVKPARAGSSFGVSRVQSADDLAAAIDHAAQFDPKVVVEAEIRGRELECGVLGPLTPGTARASVIGEIVVDSRHPFYDFEAKYLDEAHLRIDIPAELPSDVSERVRQLAVGAYAALGCEGLARVDFFYTSRGTVVVNEVNTMPGFTPMSVFPRLWAASGIEYPVLIDQLLTLALTRSRGLR